MDDRYSKFDYSRLIDWNARLTREWPFLERAFHDAPSRRLLDLGSGTGEHARFLADHGFEVVGIDSSPAMLEKSRASTTSDRVSFVDGDIRDAAASVDGSFGGAICLGNALPHLTGLDDLQRMFVSLRRVLLPGAAFVLQIINYDRIELKKERALPLTFLTDPDDPQASIVFFRPMELQSDGRVIFMPSTLRIRTDREEPVELVATRRVDIRGWRRSEVEEALRQNGFESVEAFGSYAGAPFEPAESRDVIVVAR